MRTRIKINMFLFHGQEIDYSFLKSRNCNSQLNATQNNAAHNQNAYKANSCILFLHGWGGNKNSFLNLANLLNANHNCLLITLPTTAQTTLVWTLEDYAQCVLNLLKSLGINSVQIVCHSFGFRVATLLYHLVKHESQSASKNLTLNNDKYNSKTTMQNIIFNKNFECDLITNLNTDITINKMVITGGAGPKKFNIFKKIEQNNNVCLLKQKRNKFLFKSLVSQDYFSLSATNKKTFKNVVNFNTKNLLKFDIPLLLFWGKNDSETPIWIAKKICHSNKKNAALKITNSDHFAYLKQSAIFANLVVKFL